ncbi:AI-2E family transporter [Aurantimonas sp. Leaf443]|uniref:AI-2E family transporter n=1 Tax=Aurantimonas sp. Leaf443 TaxID=1736378 RepID=UPI000A8355B9|nr:AI-2E family transporter [Aurantimonas sp. Leaf443]
MDIVSSQMLRRALPLYTALAVSMLVLIFAVILYFGREIFVPFALAILLSFALAPIVNALQRMKLPQGAAIAGAVVAAVVVIGIVGMVVANQLASLAGELPAYRTTMQEKIRTLASASDGTGPMGRAFQTIQELATDFETLGSNERVQDAREAAKPTLVTLDNGSGGTLATISTIVSPLLHPLAMVGIVLIFACFILAQREDLRNRFIRLAGTDDLQQTTAAIDDAARRLSRLLLTQLAVNTLFGIVIGTGLWFIGVPSPYLWGILAGILRFVPYVGAIIGAAFPLALAFAVDPGWSMVIWTAVLFLAVEPILGHVIEPLLYGHTSGLSPIAVILAAAIWAFLWGPVGLVLATPLTICLVVMGRYVPRLSTIDVIFGDRPALSPAQIFYQRMLTGSSREAAEQANAFLRERALATYYDEVALEGLRLAHEDVARFAVTGPRLEMLRGSTLDLVHRLDRQASPLPRGGKLNAEAAAAVDAAGPDKEVARIVKRRDELAPAFRSDAPVVCVAGVSELDEPLTEMLRQVVEKHGLGARMTTWKALRERRPTREDAKGVALVVLSFLEPLSVLHLRAAVREAHRIAPGAKIVIGIWRERDSQMVGDLRRKVHADALVTTFNEALDAILRLSTIDGTKGRLETVEARTGENASASIAA